MGLYVARRALYSIPVIVIASFLLFWFVRETFDPTAKVRRSRDPAAVERVREELRLDDPIPVQYGAWLSGAVRGDLGRSERTGEPVSTALWRAFGNTAQLVFWGVLVAAVTAVALGVFSALKQYSVFDHAVTGLAFIGLAMPPFWFGLLAIQLLAVGPKEWWDLDQPIFYFVGLHGPDQSGINLDYFRHLFLPVLTLTVGIIAEWSRFQRSSMLDVLSADYIRTARAKGVPRRRVITRHALRNALIPLVTVIALDFGVLIGGVIVTETIFSIPGMGRLFVTSLLAGDAQLLTAWVVVTAVFVVVANLVADVLYGVLDPRIRVT